MLYDDLALRRINAIRYANEEGAWLTEAKRVKTGWLKLNWQMLSCLIWTAPW